MVWIWVVSATLRDLDQLAGEGSFRQDLLARVRGFELELLPLRERREDLGLLCGALLDPAPRRRRQPVPTVDRRRPCHLSIRLADEHSRARKLPGDGHGPGGRRCDPARPPAASHSRHADAPVEVAAPALCAEDRRRRNDLVALLRAHGGNVSAVARATGKARDQIQRWIKRYQINADAIRSSLESFLERFALGAQLSCPLDHRAEPGNLAPKIFIRCVLSSVFLSPWPAVGKE